MVNVKEIAEFLNEELKINDIEDSANNGLQIENTEVITKVGFAVDACLETFQKSVSAGCQLLITHHGMILEGIKYIRGSTYQQIKFLIKNNLAVYGAHLPLDLHPQYGNNAELSRILGLQHLKPFGYYHNKPIGFMGEVDTTIDQIKKIISENNMKTFSLDFGKEHIKKIAIISGGAAKEVFQAINAKADLYITGEPLHHVHHVAKENNINVIFAGHYETEVFGLKALMPLIKKRFNIEVEFIDVPTLI